MLLFRSEEHVERHRRQRGGEAGATLSVDQVWKLAQVWYRDVLTPEWRRRTPSEAQEAFERTGLTGPFWRLAP
ncbi:MAG TPA: hypothetical protein DIT48_04015 [Actinobacteria bacterium]|jgi:hypothetical protein|nr:hypothetical protein [Actinomycetota bacterium]HCP62150.1 alkylmercury lyase [Actinomycetota bacterium]